MVVPCKGHMQSREFFLPSLPEQPPHCQQQRKNAQAVEELGAIRREGEEQEDMHLSVSPPTVHVQACCCRHHSSCTPPPATPSTTTLEIPPLQDWLILVWETVKEVPGCCAEADNGKPPLSTSCLENPLGAATRWLFPSALLSTGPLPCLWLCVRHCSSNLQREPRTNKICRRGSSPAPLKPASCADERGDELSDGKPGGREMPTAISFALHHLTLRCHSAFYSHQMADESYK